MGLRFRKSIKIFPGVRLNFGKNSMSVSAGVPGFRKTFSTTGKVTTTVGIPGTGLYYVDTKNKNSNRQQRTNTTRPLVNTQTENIQFLETHTQENNEFYPTDTIVAHETNNKPGNIVQLTKEKVKSIHKNSDDSIDWTEVLVCDEAPDEAYNQELWRYYHQIAPKILSGDIDSYLQLIYDINPLDDLLDYGSEFEFGTDDSKKIVVEFDVNIKALSQFKSTETTQEYNNLLQDYICSVCIRIARDMFALLPVSKTIVHATINGETVISVDFGRTQLNKLKFGFIDPSETLEKFNHNMNFTFNYGFCPVDRIDN